MTEKAMSCDNCFEQITEQYPDLSYDQLEEKFGEEDCRCNRFIECSNCGKPAVFETYTLGVYVCDENECIVEKATEEWCQEEVSNENHQEYGEPHKKDDIKW